MEFNDAKIQKINYALEHWNKINIRPDSDWFAMFKEYNVDNKKNLGLGCRICYLKVSRYLKQKYGI